MHDLYFKKIEEYMQFDRERQNRAIKFETTSGTKTRHFLWDNTWFGVMKFGSH